MSYYSVIEHIQEILHECGDNANLIPTGNNPPSQIKPGDLSIEVKQTVIKIENDCFKIKPPYPLHPNNPPGGYIITRIRISKSMIDDYSKGHPYTNDELKKVMANKEFMFGYFDPII